MKRTSQLRSPQSRRRLSTALHETLNEHEDRDRHPNFDTTFIDHKEDKASEGTYRNASTLKREVIKIINNQLIGYLNTLQQIDEENFGEFARQVDQLITDNNQIVKQRLKLDTDKETVLS